MPVAPPSVKLDWPRFKKAILDKLNGYILIDDEPHPDAVLPDNVMPRCTAAEIQAGYALCWQLLDRGADMKAFRRLVWRIARQGSATPEDQLAFKDVRGRCKHLRFGFVNFDRRHIYPVLLQSAIVLMGNMQDAFKNGRRYTTLYYGLWLLLTTSPLFWWLAKLELRHFRPDTPEGVLAWQRKENDNLAQATQSALKGNGMSAHAFHCMRKVISRRTSFNDTLRVIRPSTWLDDLAKSLATMNGMMGELHDVLIERAMDGQQDYRHDQFMPPKAILESLGDFVNQARGSGNVPPDKHVPPLAMPEGERR
ncbi:hypothetical protein E3E12_04075 [Formicincola oecophyllae]|uniref:Uncharacterized protein n=1 Tax=Formicincola oecophyllae TaxID=2558361 RepID=A0A4Y6U7W2_9PROT|nr:hypothetical protein [Formicincola oecophyllae]QDH13509.1 hypothetical protein E3E12_04075 [Formicincola oecophyllae]